MLILKYLADNGLDFYSTGSPESVSGMVRVRVLILQPRSRDLNPGSWDMHASNNPTTQHHLETYGPVRNGNLILEQKTAEILHLNRMLSMTTSLPISLPPNSTQVHGWSYLMMLGQNILSSLQSVISVHE